MITAKEYEIKKRKNSGKTYHYAQEGEFLFKSGDYEEVKTIKLLKPIKSTLPGALGIHFWFEITRPCTLSRIYSYQGHDFYAAPQDAIKSTYAGLSVIANGDLVGVYVNQKNGGYGWFVDNTNYNGGVRSIWTRLFKQKELGYIEEGIII